MPNSSSANHWRQVVERLLKAEMSRRGVRYQDLSDRLKAIGVTQSADNLRNKINKGILGADLLLQIVYVLNVTGFGKADLEEIIQASQESE